MHGAQPDEPVVPRQRSLIRAALALVVIVCGLSLRWYGFPLGLPAFVVKYGGSLLWATMVFLLVGVLLPPLTRSQLAAIAMVIAIVVEFSRLVHAPWLDTYRLTTAGALLLGRIFSLWNLVAYLIGIVAGVWLDSRVSSFGQDRILPRRSKLNSQEAGSTRE
ncbi:ribosomal maturation YjgA family protein [Bradyrhizobium sp. AZCC 2230]|uniref:ribosomal maturation YjgA family protein n=1 Tax=Bradyrhizobium sp. AZCC 2230 TaxID=3117021 RepID=UPI002FF11465